MAHHHNLPFLLLHHELDVCHKILCLHHDIHQNQLCLPFHENLTFLEYHVGAGFEDN